MHLTRGRIKRVSAVQCCASSPYGAALPESCATCLMVRSWRVAVMCMPSDTVLCNGPLRVVIPLTRLDIAAARGGTTFYPAMEHLHSGSCLSDLQQLLCAACASSIRINSAAGGCVGLDWWKDHLSSASYGPDTPIVLVLHGLSGADQSCMLSRFRDLAISL